MVLLKEKHLMTNQLPPPMKVSLFIWILGILFYMFGFFHRVAPAVMTTELMLDFKIMLKTVLAFLSETSE